MTITKSIQQLEWKYNNHWNITQTDIDALNTIKEFAKQKHQEQIEANQLFAKLYIMVFSQFIERYKTDIYDDIPQKELHKLLDKDLSVFIQRFTTRLNERDKQSLFTSLGIELEHPVTKTALTKEKEFEAVKHALNDETKLKQFYDGLWDYEDVKDNIELQINHVIDKYR